VATPVSLLQAGIQLLDKRLVRREVARLPSGAGLLSILRRHQCLLICGRCGNALATARVGPIALIRVQHVTGYDVAPLQGEVAPRVAAARVSAAEAVAQQVGRRPEDDLEVLAARHEVEYLRRQVGEIAFDLQCPSCESRYWRSLPHLANEVRGAPAGQVTLA
jgi:ribosomal protein L34E